MAGTIKTAREGPTFSKAHVFDQVRDARHKISHSNCGIHRQCCRRRSDDVCRYHTIAIDDSFDLYCIAATLYTDIQSSFAMDTGPPCILPMIYRVYTRR